MPLAEIEIVGGDGLAPGLAGSLADAIGEALGAPAGTTWVRLRLLPRDQYGESGGPIPVDIQPVFVTVTISRRPDDVAGAVRDVTSAVASATERAYEHVHVILAPDARGRVAFGGSLVE